MSNGGKRLDPPAGSDRESCVGDPDSDEESAEWRSKQALRTKMLYFLKELNQSAERIEAVLVEHASMDPHQHFRLAEQLARVLLQARTQDREEWPETYNSSKVRTLININGNFIAEHLDIPDNTMCLIPDGRFWVRILEAAFHGWPGMLPVHHTSTQTMSDCFDRCVQVCLDASPSTRTFSL